ncbi:hypothetical protein QCA50_004795 [Cerrena zonata]|uniref:Uncharacterized protein n=1 Tax=Cerrena zonata TaxID=2478898 RepID=A0AAW0GPG3_9APHY
MHFPKLPIFRNKKAGPLVKPRCLHVVVDRNGNIIAQSNNIVDINVPSLRQFDALLYYGDVPADKYAGSLIPLHIAASSDDIKYRAEGFEMKEDRWRFLREEREYERGATRGWNVTTKDSN